MSTCLIYLYRLRLPFGLHRILPAYPPYRPYYQVSVRQATCSLLLPLTHTSRCESCKSLWGSSATTPLVDFHHSQTACPSYKIETTGFPGSLDHILLPLFISYHQIYIKPFKLAIIRTFISVLSV